MERQYRVTHYREFPVHGVWVSTKSLVLPLDRACARLIEHYGEDTSVRALGEGNYEIAGGAARMTAVSFLSSQMWVGGGISADAEIVFAEAL